MLLVSHFGFGEMASTKAAEDAHAAMANPVNAESWRIVGAGREDIAEKKTSGQSDRVRE